MTTTCGCGETIRSEARAQRHAKECGLQGYPRGWAEKREELVEFCARRQWQRMTRGGIKWDDLPEGDRRAARALVVPVLDDAQEWGRRA